jgi:hypothetical protein
MTTSQRPGNDIVSTLSDPKADQSHGRRGTDLDVMIPHHLRLVGVLRQARSEVLQQQRLFRLVHLSFAAGQRKVTCQRKAHYLVRIDVFFFLSSSLFLSQKPYQATPICRAQSPPDEPNDPQRLPCRALYQYGRLTVTQSNLKLFNHSCFSTASSVSNLHRKSSDSVLMNFSLRSGLRAGVCAGV